MAVYTPAAGRGTLSLDDWVVLVPEPPADAVHVISLLDIRNRGTAARNVTLATILTPLEAHSHHPLERLELWGTSAAGQQIAAGAALRDEGITIRPGEVLAAKLDAQLTDEDEYLTWHVAYGVHTIAGPAQ